MRTSRVSTSDPTAVADERVRSNRLSVPVIDVVAYGLRIVAFALLLALLATLP